MRSESSFLGEISLDFAEIPPRQPLRRLTIWHMFLKTVFFRFPAKPDYIISLLFI